MKITWKKEKHFSLHEYLNGQIKTTSIVKDIIWSASENVDDKLSNAL